MSVIHNVCGGDIEHIISQHHPFFPSLSCRNENMHDLWIKGLTCRCSILSIRRLHIRQKTPTVIDDTFHASISELLICSFGSLSERFLTETLSLFLRLKHHQHSWVSLVSGTQFIIIVTAYIINDIPLIKNERWLSISLKFHKNTHTHELCTRDDIDWQL